MPQAQIIGVAAFAPERIVPNAYAETAVDAAGVNAAFLRGVRERRFASPEYSALDLGVLALERALEQTSTPAIELDLIICSAMLNDILGNGIAAGVQKRVGAVNATILNVDTNCTSFMSALGIARAFIEAGVYRRIAIVMATNFISRMPDAYRESPTAGPLGDGAAAMLLAAGDHRSIVALHERAYGEHYGLLHVEPYSSKNERRPYWKGTDEGLIVRFSSDMVDGLMTNALRLVPRAVRACLQTANMTTDDVSLLVTHQPNQFFLDEWRARLEITAPRVHDTLERHGNLFQATLPFTLADAVEKGKLHRGDIVALGTFANAGDLFCSGILRW